MSQVAFADAAHVGIAGWLACDVVLERDGRERGAEVADARLDLALAAIQRHDADGGVSVAAHQDGRARLDEAVDVTHTGHGAEERVGLRQLVCDGRIVDGGLGKSEDDADVVAVSAVEGLVEDDGGGGGLGVRNEEAAGLQDGRGARGEESTGARQQEEPPGEDEPP